MARTETIKEDAAQGSYLCPQCLTIHYRNDRLFETRRTTTRCDMRQAAQRYAVAGGAANDPDFAHWRQAGVAPVLLDWRGLPENRRRWQNGVIAAVQDVDGSWCTRPVCPGCHQPLSLLETVVFGWQSGGMNGGVAARLLQMAVAAQPARWNYRQMEGVGPLPYDRLADPAGQPLLGIPAGLEQMRGGYGQSYRRRCCTAASGAVVRLDLSLDTRGMLDDTSAYETMEALLAECNYTGTALRLPVVFWLNGQGLPDTMAAFAGQGGQLRQSIDYCFAKKCVIADPDRDPQVAADAVAWLIEQAGAAGDGPSSS